MARVDASIVARTSHPPHVPSPTSLPCARFTSQVPRPAFRLYYLPSWGIQRFAKKSEILLKKLRFRHLMDYRSPVSSAGRPDRWRRPSGEASEREAVENIDPPLCPHRQEAVEGCGSVHASVAKGEVCQRGGRARLCPRRCGHVKGVPSASAQPSYILLVFKHFKSHRKL